MRDGTTRLRLILLLFPAAHSTLCEGADAHRAARWTPGRGSPRPRGDLAATGVRATGRRMNPSRTVWKPIRAECRDARVGDVRAVRVPRMRHSRPPACTYSAATRAHPGRRRTDTRGPPLTGGSVAPDPGVSDRAASVGLGWRVQRSAGRWRSPPDDLRSQGSALKPHPAVGCPAEHRTPPRSHIRPSGGPAERRSRAHTSRRSTETRRQGHVPRSHHRRLQLDLATETAPSRQVSERPRTGLGRAEDRTYRNGDVQARRRRTTVVGSTSGDDLRRDDVRGQSRGSDQAIMVGQLTARGRSLDGEDLAVRPHQRQAPADQAIEGSERTRQDSVVGLANLLGPLPPDGHPLCYPQVIHTVGKEGAAPQQWLDQVDRQVGSQDRHRDPRQPGARAHVGHGRAVGDQLRDSCTVQDVTSPDPVDLARTEQTPLDTSTYQYIFISTYRFKTRLPS